MGMLKLVALAVLSLACSACSSSASCMKVCVNDPEPTPEQINQCNASKLKTTCSTQCSSTSSCLASHAKDVCGADGKTDAMKTIQLDDITCKPTPECAACLQKA